MAVPSRPRLKIGWTVYTALLTLFSVGGEVYNLARGGPVDAVGVAGWILTAALLAATWGYALQRAIGAPGYWRAVFWIVTGATLVMLIPLAFGTLDAILFTLLLLVLVSPAYVAAFRYAYRSAPLWAAPH